MSPVEPRGPGAPRRERGATALPSVLLAATLALALAGDASADPLEYLEDHRELNGNNFFGTVVVVAPDPTFSDFSESLTVGFGVAEQDSILRSASMSGSAATDAAFEFFMTSRFQVSFRLAAPVLYSLSGNLFHSPPSPDEYATSAASVRLESLPDGPIIARRMVSGSFDFSGELLPGDYDLLVLAGSGGLDGGEPANFSFEFRLLEVCGNDILEGTEQCDGTDAAACPGLCQVDCSCAPPTPVRTLSTWGFVLLLATMLLAFAWFRRWTRA